MRPRRSGLRGRPRSSVVTHGQNVAHRLSVTPEVAAQISSRTAMILRKIAPVGEKNSRRHIQPTNQAGQIGVYIPPEAIHLWYLDRGFEGFNMYALEGKTVPMRTPNGLIFRVAKNVGRRVITTRDEHGQIVGSKIAWRHPGVAPMNFIIPAIRLAIREWMRANPKMLAHSTDINEQVRLAIWDSLKRANI